MSVDRIRQANQLKNNPLLTEAFQKVEQDCFSAFKVSKKSEEREAIHAKLTALQHFRSALNGIIDGALRDEPQS